MSAAAPAEIDLRCPLGVQQLLGKIQARGERAHVDKDNLLELACRDCARENRRRDASVMRVLHYYDFAGEFVRTQIVHRS